MTKVQMQIVLSNLELDLKKTKEKLSELDQCNTMTELNFEGFVEMKNEEIAQLKKENETLKEELAFSKKEITTNN